MKNKEVLIDILKGRRSIRRYESRAVPRKLLEELVEAARWAPSAANRQDWFFTVVTSRDMIVKMAEAVRLRWRKIVEDNRDLGLIVEIEKYSANFTRFRDAPAVIAVSAREVDSFLRRLLGDKSNVTAGSAASAAMAAQNLMLAAHAAGLGSCCMTGAAAAGEELGRMIGLPRRKELVCLIALGWPAESPEAPPRKTVGDIAAFLE